MQRRDFHMTEQNRHVKRRLVTRSVLKAEVCGRDVANRAFNVEECETKGGRTWRF